MPENDFSDLARVDPGFQVGEAQPHDPLKGDARDARCLHGLDHSIGLGDVQEEEPYHEDHETHEEVNGLNTETAEHAEVARATYGRRSRPLSDGDNGRRNHKRSIAVVCVAAPLAPSRPASGPVA